MGRVFVFDQHTKEMLPGVLGANAELNPDFDWRNPLDCISSLLQVERDTLLLAPSTSEGFSCVIHVRFIPRPEPAIDTEPIVPEAIVSEAPMAEAPVLEPAEPEPAEAPALVSELVEPEPAVPDFVVPEQLTPAPIVEANASAPIDVPLLPKEPVATPEPMYEATGFLGLSDTLYEPPRPRRWWHWFWS